MEVAQAEVFQFLAQVVHAQPTGDGRIDFQGFAGDAAARVRPHRAQGAHVVQPVGQLDHDHPQVLGHRQEHLAEILGLRFELGIEVNVGQLADAVHQFGDFRPEARAEVLLIVLGVLDDIVQQRRQQGFEFEADIGEDAGHGQRMEDVGLAAFAVDAGVRFGREITAFAQLPDGLRLQIFADDRAQIVDAQPQVIQPLVIDGQLAELLEFVANIPQRRAHERRLLGS